MAQAKSRRGVAVTALRCRKHASSFTPLQKHPTLVCLEAVQGHTPPPGGSGRGMRGRTGTEEGKRHRVVSFQYIQVLKSNHCPVLWDTARSFFSVCELEMGKTSQLGLGSV